jgi:hypothetical protein
MIMNLSNPLPPIRQAYEAAQGCFRVARRAIKTQHPQTKQRLLQRTDFETQTLADAELMIIQNIQEAKGLYILTLWAAFERFLRDYLQYKYKEAVLQQMTPPDFANAMYHHVYQEIEFWRPEDILDSLRDSLLKTESELVGKAKAIYKYRNWIAHGKSTKKNVSAVLPKSAYTTLESIVNILLAN